MIQQRHANRITHLKTTLGNKLTPHLDIEKELVSFFRNLLTEPQLDRSAAIDSITRHIPQLVTDEHNECLLRPISLVEVEEAIMSMVSGKSPGPNGFTSAFFHHCWSIVKLDVWALVTESQRISGILPVLNATFITMILKEAQATDPSQFRPIALCNVIYKIITKVLASCIKPIMPLLVGLETIWLCGGMTNP
jgi:hypothetical protein